MLPFKMSAEDFERLPEIGVEFGIVGDRFGVPEREREYIDEARPVG
jgi:hypothetical protein